MLTRADESDIIDDIKDGIGIALSWREASAHSIDSIKLNKLAYIAIERLEVPITFGWYKYGPAPVDLQYSEAAVSSKTKEECEAPDEPRVPQRDYYSPLEYAYFFDKELDKSEKRFSRMLPMSKQFPRVSNGSLNESSIITMGALGSMSH